MATADKAGPAEEGATSIFFSYARADRKRALPLIAALESAGCKVWWDGLLEGGENFLPSTEAALESADAVVVLWSATSIDSHWVRDEATRGRDRRCLVPLSLDGSQAPLGFRQFQVIDLKAWRGKVPSPETDRVIRAVLALNGGNIAPAPYNLVQPSRRGLMIGAGAVALASVGGLAAWRGGLIGTARTASNSIAILPFRNLSGDPSQAYFSDGLSEEIRATLSRNRMLRIAAPTSSAGAVDQSSDVLTIAKLLGVAFVLRGSVRRDANQLRISAELVDGHDASLDWTQSLDRKLTDVFALQSEIAAIVARTVSDQLSAQAIAAGTSGDRMQLGGTEDVAAFDAYLRGQAMVEDSADEASDRLALAQFDRAIALDPHYASALAARSKILAAIANETGQTSELRGLYDRAVASAEQAVHVTPQLAEAHSALGYALYNGRLDPKAAREPYDRSRTLGAGDADVLRAFALFCAYTDRAEDAAQAIAIVLALDPLNSGAFRAAGYVAYAQRDYPRTIAMMTKALALKPRLSTASAAIGNALYVSGKTGEARTAYLAEPLAVFRLQGLAMLEHRTGNPAAAQSAMRALINAFGSNSAYQQAQVLAQWGKADEALAQLEQAAATRDSGLLLTRTDPLLDPLRKDPRFGGLLSRLGLS